MSGRVLGLAVGLLLAGIAQGASNKSDKPTGAYRWVDKHGVVHYGDRIPPEYAQQEAVRLNEQGVVVERREAPKTPEQLAEEARQREELIKRQQRDNFLLTTYTSEKDIEQLRDSRLEQIRAQRVAAEQQLAELNGRLLTLQTRAMMFKPYSDQPNAKRMPDGLAEDLVRTLNEVRTQQGVIVSKNKEEENVRAEFQADIDRFRELKAPKTASSVR